MTSRLAGNLRLFLHLLLGIAFVILTTGGGRLGKVDFISLDAWIAVALLPAFALAYAGQPVLYAWLGRVRDRVASYPLVFAGVVFTLLAAAHLAKFFTLHTSVFDAGYVYQGIFQAFGTPFLKCDVCHGGSYLGAHIAYTFALLSPFANLLGTPFGIPVLQAGLGFLTFFVLLKAFRNDLDRKVLAFAFFVLLCVRGIRESFIFDFREDLLGALFFALAFFALKKKRPILALVPFALAALSKESAALLLPFAMVAGLYAQGKPKRGLLVIYIGFACALSAFVFLWALPHYTPSSGSGSDLARRLAYLGSSPKEILLNLGIHPIDSAIAVFSHLATWERLRYLLVVAAPITLIAFRSFNPYYIPGFVLLLGNLLSDAATQRMMQFHYEVLLIPFFGFGLCETLGRLGKDRPLPRQFFTMSLFAALALSGTWPLSHFKEYLRDSDKIGDVVWGAKQIAGTPAGEVILGDSMTIPFLTHRENLRLIESFPYRGDALSGMGTLPISDARFAILLRENGARIGPEWMEAECGAQKIICAYKRVSP